MVFFVIPVVIQEITILRSYGPHPSPGVYTIVAIGEDSSGNVVMSSPVTLTSTFGIDPPQVRMTSPSSGTQRSVSDGGAARRRTGSP